MRACVFAMLELFVLVQNFIFPKQTNSWQIKIIIFVWWKFITEKLLFVWFRFNQCGTKNLKEKMMNHNFRKKETEQNGCSDYFSSSQISCIVYFSLKNKQLCRAHKMAAVHLNYKTLLNKLFSFTFLKRFYEF